MYKQGLIFGKFMPVHAGHLALIDFAATHCQHLIVSMSFMPTDPISPALRFAWLQQIFKNRPEIEVVQELDDFHDDSLPLWEATKLWAAFIHSRFPEIEVFFCSESYGEPLSLHLGLPCVYFDKARLQVPVSATQIRANPFDYWAFIPAEVRPYFVKKICLYGPESTGKSTLSEALAQHYDTVFVPEMARKMLTSNDFTIDDIITIGEAQTQEVITQTRVANKLLFCDTDLITTQIYAQNYFGEIPAQLVHLEGQIQYDYYFLLAPDLPWEADNLRDLGHRREEMFALFKNKLDIRQLPYQIVKGSWQERFEAIKQIVNQLFYLR